MRDYRKTLWFTLAAPSLILSAACRAPKNSCPIGLKGLAAAGSDVLQWGGAPAKVSASINNIAVECIPEAAAKTEIEQAVRRVPSSYVIAATATVNQYVFDQNWMAKVQQLGSLDDFVEFEAVSSSGVVLGSGRGKFQIVPGNFTATVSARIEKPDRCRSQPSVGNPSTMDIWTENSRAVSNEPCARKHRNAPIPYIEYR